MHALIRAQVSGIWLVISIIFQQDVPAFFGLLYVSLFATEPLLFLLLVRIEVIKKVITSVELELAINLAKLFFLFFDACEHLSRLRSLFVRPLLKDVRGKCDEWSYLLMTQVRVVSWYRMQQGLCRFRNRRRRINVRGMSYLGLNRGVGGWKLMQHASQIPSPCLRLCLEVWRSR